MNAIDIASDRTSWAKGVYASCLPGSVKGAHPGLQAAVLGLSGLVCHTPEPTPSNDDDDDEEEKDRGSSGGNIDPDDDEGDFDDDDDDEDETLWTSSRRSDPIRYGHG